MIYIYLLSVFALLPVIAYILSQKTSNKGYVFGFSLIVVLICLFVFVGKFSFLGTLQEQAFNDEILSYIDEDQLISSEVINSFEETIVDNKLFIIQNKLNNSKKININTVEFKVLNKHPYLSYAQTKTLLKYRKLMGTYNSLNEIVENHLLDTLTYNKINPYLTIQ